MQNNTELEIYLRKLERAPIVELRRIYTEQFRRDQPKAFGPDLLRRSIAQKVQESAYGCLSA